MTSSRSRQVIVVGAGPAGAVLANLLATRGVRTTLLERQSDFAREFRGEVLSPSGLEVLRSLDMDAALEAVPHRSPDRLEIYANGRCVLDLEAKRLGPAFVAPCAYSQTALLEAIVAETVRRSDLVFERGASVKELLREGGRVVGVRVRTERGEENLGADLVIGCDGRASVVRRDAALTVERDELPMDVVWFKIPPPAAWKGEARARFCMGRGNLFIGYVTYDGMLQNAWVIAKGSFGELRARGIEQWVEQMADHVPGDLSEHLRRHRDGLTHPFLLSTAADRVERWSEPGVLVLGDAAHTMSPVGGQGINIALRDVVVAANHLVPVLKGGGAGRAIDQAAQRVQAERRGEIRRIQALQSLPPRLFLPKTRVAEAARRLPNLLRFAPVRSLVAKRVQPMLNGTTRVALRV